MSLLFNHARRHDLFDRNPISLVRQSAKRRTAPEVLTVAEIQQILRALASLEHVAMLLEVSTGLRQSELFALKWMDVDFETKQLSVTRSIVQQVVGACKTEASQKPVPLHDHVAKVLQEWKRQSRYSAADDWVFASPVKDGQKLTGERTSCAARFFLPYEALESQNALAGIPSAIATRHFCESAALTLK